MRRSHQASVATKTQAQLQLRLTHFECTLFWYEFYWKRTLTRKNKEGHSPVFERFLFSLQIVAVLKKLKNWVLLSTLI